MEHWIAPLLVWAARLSGYPVPDVPPAVEFRDRSFFVEYVCKGRPDCPYAGLYEHGVVYLDRALNARETDALMVHEAVHYMQDLSGKFPDTCEGRRDKEREAYKVQREFYWHAHGRLDPVLPVVFGRCPSIGGVSAPQSAQ